jgi:hypothetical protein
VLTTLRPGVAATLPDVISVALQGSGAPDGPPGGILEGQGLSSGGVMNAAIRWAVVALLSVHGLIHLMGVAKGFGWAEVPALTHPIGPATAWLWLAASLLVLATAVTVAIGAPEWRWGLAALAAVVSQAAVLTSWHDARAGTAANLVLVLVAAYGFVSWGPTSQAAQFDRLAATALAAVPSETAVVTEADLDRLPPLVASYVRRSGAVGRPSVHAFRATVHGRIRNGPDAPWMRFTGEQVNTYGATPRRFFHLDATMHGLPVSVLHVYDADGATMRAELLSVLPVVDARGPEMDRSETVTLFNDLAVWAPGALVDAPVEWSAVDEHTVRGAFTAHGQRVTADLVFDDEGDLVDFVSHDRARASADGSSFSEQTWNTPLTGYADVRGHHVAVRGSARWDAPEPEGPFTYVEMVVDDLVDNPASPVG